MRSRPRMGLLLCAILFAALGGWLVALNLAAEPPSASAGTSAPVTAEVTACPGRHHRFTRCCQPLAHTSGSFVLSRCLTIAAGPNPATAGEIVTISGRLYGPHPRHAAIVLWRRLPGSRRFH